MQNSAVGMFLSHRSHANAVGGLQLLEDSPCMQTMHRQACRGVQRHATAKLQQGCIDGAAGTRSIRSQIPDTKYSLAPKKTVDIFLCSDTHEDLTPFPPSPTRFGLPRRTAGLWPQARRLRVRSPWLWQGQGHLAPRARRAQERTSGHARVLGHHPPLLHHRQGPR